MKLIFRYILRTHAAPFIFGTATVVFIFLMQFVMNYLDQLVGKGLNEWLILELITYNIAWMLVLAVPMGVLFSTLMAFGSMSAAHEITIIKASGGSLIRMMMPVVIMGFIVSVALFWFNDQVLPEANHSAKILMSDIQRKKPTFALESGQFSTQLDGYTILARKVDSATGTMKGVTIYDMSQFQRRNIISADTGFLKFSDDFKNLILDLKNGEIHQVNLGVVDNYRIVNFEKYKISIPASGFAFEQSSSDIVAKGDRELNIRDMEEIVDSARVNKNKFLEDADSLMKSMLNSYIFGKIKDTGNIGREKPVKNLNLPDESYKGISVELYNDSPDTTNEAILNRIMSKTNIDKSIIVGQQNQAEFFDTKIGQYQVEIYKKYAIPFACLVFVFVGAPLGIITKGGNFGLSAGISLLFYIFYWVSLIGGEKLADRGILQPWLAMWLGNIIIGILGIILTLRVNYESLHFLDIRNLWRKN